MICVVLQVRLDSTRLPRKALLPLGGKPIIVRVMENLKRVRADAWVLACDVDSAAVLSPLAAECGFVCIPGPKDDVLERFCIVIKKMGADVILRATGDNPWLFADAAQESLARFAELRADDKPVDYFTFSGLPHGSGIEVFSARRLLEAGALTDSSYDHEHVGPAFYRHPDRFRCVFETAPERWYHPEMRTTIDTREDYECACHMYDYLASKKIDLPAESSLVLEAWAYVSRPILFIPSTQAGRGTGHFKRLSGLISQMSASWRCVLYLPLYSPFVKMVPESIRNCVTHVIPESAWLVVLDNFRTDISDMNTYRGIGPVIALDEGGSSRHLADYLLDIIPGLPGELCSPNVADVAYLPLPLNRRKKTVESISSALVVAGGENAVGYALPVSEILASMDLEVTVIDPSTKGLHKHESGYTISGPVPHLRETLCHYDLVVTHYGFTAFEALAAGCRVILFSPSMYHYRLARAHGFSVMKPGLPEPQTFRKFLGKGVRIPSIIKPESGQKNLVSEIERFVTRKALPCPLCGSHHGSVVARYSDRTVSRCLDCGMDYLSFLVVPQKVYAKSYFFEEYRAQYGKTYLEDFESIKAQGSRRLSIMKRILSRHRSRRESPGLLDIGCAYGPFLSAAKDDGWKPEGTDICEEAVVHVRDTLGIPAVVSAFPAPDAENTLQDRTFDAVTLWYVIEHFDDLLPVFDTIRRLLPSGGILAFSTPSSKGITGRTKPADFYRNSPRDHYSIWNPFRVRRQLLKHGFTVVRIVSTGHHPERFPIIGKAKAGSLRWGFFLLLSKLFALGDTFEVYAIRNGRTEDA
jgi:spore coat polysaccharide biosynthesis protein SpsF (cytidylyltransferase family)/2-polyprenyl-3-methyl-5-hydroxy-6-metoxy-1,4-benzoquinol methylase